jgi:exosome complex RNA-binding protein Rrp42 (RNase PH superfamily)
MKSDFLKTNHALKKLWGKRYIDLISLIINPDNKVLVFTPDCKFISQDTWHLTKPGAAFFATLLDQQLREIIKLK